MKIGIIFSEKDWTASEIALKIQSLAYSSDLDCYISPKHIARDDNKVALNLKKCNYILFIAHDIDTPDTITQSELKLVKDKQVIGIVKESFDYDFNFSKVFRYSLKKDAIEYIKEEIQNLKRNKKSIRKAKLFYY